MYIIYDYIIYIITSVSHTSILESAKGTPVNKFKYNAKICRHKLTMAHSKVYTSAKAQQAPLIQPGLIQYQTCERVDKRRNNITPQTQCQVHIGGSGRLLSLQFR